MIRGLDHVQVAAPPACEDAARAFYADLLGLQEVPKPPILAARGGAWFQVGAQQLHVGVEEPFSPARKAHPAFASDAAGELAKRLSGARHPGTWDDAVPGVRRFFVADPWGNRLEFVETGRASGR